MSDRVVTLALDLGTKTGYAILRADGKIVSGAESFHARNREGPGGRWVRFRAWLVGVKTNNPDIGRIVYEDVKRHVGTDAAHCYGALRAIVEMFGEHHRIEYSGIGVGTIKKGFTGKGNAKKPEMMARCRELGFHPADDNEADAIALLHVHLHREAG